MASEPSEVAAATSSAELESMIQATMLGFGGNFLGAYEDGDIAWHSSSYLC